MKDLIVNHLIDLGFNPATDRVIVDLSMHGEYVVCEQDSNTFKVYRLDHKGYTQAQYTLYNPLTLITDFTDDYR